MTLLILRGSLDFVKGGLLSSFQSENGLTDFWYTIVSAGVVVAWLFVLDGHRMLRGTTLATAWTWSFLSATAWMATWFADQCGSAMTAALADHAWYVCGVLSLCSPIAVLGSRRPGTQVWTWFIVVPMLLALFWPIAALRLQGSELRRIQLETPQLVAFCLVLIMGVGNYCGTRFTIAALMYGCSILAIVLSSSAASPLWLMDRSATRFWCTAVMVLAIGVVKKSTRPVAATRFDQLWFDFFDLFGIVWGRRIQDRVNFIARKEGLPVRLELDGFVWPKVSSFAGPSAPIGERVRHEQTNVETGNLNTTETEARIEHILRWLLRRFVNPPWIDDRLGSRSDQRISELVADS